MSTTLVQRAVGWLLQRFSGFEFALDTVGRSGSNLPDIISLSELLERGIVWTAVPKRRRSLEKRQMRRFYYKFMAPYKPKTNLVCCANCGNFIERQFLCTHCYSRVRMETEKAKQAMSIDRFQFDWPAQEVAVAYQGEDAVAQNAKKAGKFVIDVDRPRPKWWFGANLLTKSNLDESEPVVSENPQKKE